MPTTQPSTPTHHTCSSLLHVYIHTYIYVYVYVNIYIDTCPRWQCLRSLQYLSFLQTCICHCPFWFHRHNSQLRLSRQHQPQSLTLSMQVAQASASSGNPSLTTPWISIIPKLRNTYYYYYNIAFSVCVTLPSVCVPTRSCVASHLEQWTVQ